jgi:hypothetical protein
VPWRWGFSASQQGSTPQSWNPQRMVTAQGETKASHKKEVGRNSKSKTWGWVNDHENPNAQDLGFNFLAESLNRTNSKT